MANLAFCYFLEIKLWSEGNKWHMPTQNKPQMKFKKFFSVPDEKSSHEGHIGPDDKTFLSLDMIRFSTPFLSVMPKGRKF